MAYQNLLVIYIAEVLRKDISPFQSLWYDMNWDWTQVSRIIDEHYTHWDNEPVFQLLYQQAFERIGMPSK